MVAKLELIIGHIQQIQRQGNCEIWYVKNTMSG